MGKPILEMEVETVGELKSLLSVISDGMPVFDATGERLCIRIFEKEREHFMEVA